MSSASNSSDVDAHLVAHEKPRRVTFEQLRRDLLELMPDGVEGLSYGMPVIREGGKAIVGYEAFANHCSLFPHSGGVLADCGPFPSWCEASKGTLRFPIGKRLPRALLRRIIAARRQEVAALATSRR